MTQTQDWSHDTELARAPTSARRARAFVIDSLVEHRLLYLVDAMRLVASELVTNALLHTDGSCTVTVGRAGHLVTLVVTDDSPVAPLRPDPEAMDDGGRGLAIVEMLSVAWGTTFDRAGTKSVWASFQIRAQAG